MSAPTYARVTEVVALLQHLADRFKDGEKLRRGAADDARRRGVLHRELRARGAADAYAECAEALHDAALSAHRLGTHPH